MDTHDDMEYLNTPEQFANVGFFEHKISSSFLINIG